MLLLLLLLQLLPKALSQLPAFAVEHRQPALKRCPSMPLVITALALLMQHVCWEVNGIDYTYAVMWIRVSSCCDGLVVCLLLL